mmetsp:Transcript_10649/g.25630  ORF Transcript_10649/g.25630 Transcript_10649/m.25630 type:complete len:342 (+) Transcript_10649:46-1071(+)
MYSNIDLTIQRICGIARRTGGVDEGRNDASCLSAIKANVSFFGTIPNMKVFSFDMCPKSGSLSVESSTPEIFGVEEKDDEEQIEEWQLLDLHFSDPFHKRQNQTQTSTNPHLQFQLREESKGNEDIDEHKSSDADKNESQSHETLTFQIVLKLPDVGVIAEGMAKLRLAKDGFERLPIDLEVPIIQTAKKDSSIIAEDDLTQSSQIFFDNCAYICVHLSESVSAIEENDSPPNVRLHGLRFHSFLDEAEHGIKAKEVYEADDDVRETIFDTEFVEFGNKNEGKQRFWAFECSSAMEITHSIKSFFDGMRRYRTNSTDPEELQLFTSSTMTSTILTRESLEI